jgi:hypothetical protein
MTVQTSHCMRGAAIALAVAALAIGATACTGSDDGGVIIAPPPTTTTTVYGATTTTVAPAATTTTGLSGGTLPSS